MRPSRFRARRVEPRRAVHLTGRSQAGHAWTASHGSDLGKGIVLMAGVTLLRHSWRATAISEVGRRLPFIHVSSWARPRSRSPFRLCRLLFTWWNSAVQ